MDKMKNFIWSDHSTPKEFEDGWNDVLQEFDLTDNTWLKDLYELRAMWVPAYFNGEPMVGFIRTTSRSESSNFFSTILFIKEIRYQSFIFFTRVLYKNKVDNALLNHRYDITPRLVNKKKIEKHASEIYTRSMFYKIEEQISYNTGYMVIDGWSINGDIKTVKSKDPFYKNISFEVLYLIWSIFNLNISKSFTYKLIVVC